MALNFAYSQTIIPAIDFTELQKFEDILRETANHDRVGGYKIGATIGLLHGLPKLVSLAKKYTSKALIYDHQKAGTDIPDTGKAFTKMLKDIGIDALIIFPLSGPEAQKAWINSAGEVGLPIIAGGYMTHKAFVVSDGGYIADSATESMYTVSAENKITDFVVPGNKPDVIGKIRNLLVSKGVDPTFYSPGFINQGGNVSEAAKAAGAKWHAIIGRAIYESNNISKTVSDLTAELK